MLSLEMLVRQIIRCEKGGITLIFGLSAMSLFLMIGLAIDSSRSYNVSSKVQSALDAAALAGAKMLDIEGTTDSEVLDKAQAFFETRLPSLNITKADISNFRVEIDHIEGLVTAQADVSVANVVGVAAHAFGDTVFSPTSRASYKAKKIELALIFDITGSMCNTAPGNSDPACTSGARLDALKAAAEDMIDKLHSSNPDAGAIKVSVVPYSGSVNAGIYGAGVSGGASTDGCVVERSGFAAYTNARPSTGGPMGTSSAAAAPFYSCPPAALRPLTELSVASEYDALRDVILNLKASGGTAGHIGLALGWYTLTPDWNSVWPDNPARDFDPDRVIKAIVLMTDGMFNISYANGGENHPWPDLTSTDPALIGTSGNQALNLCNAIRAPSDVSNKISLYTIGFQAPPDAEGFLKSCSGEENFYSADSASMLSESFRDIVNKLTSLRIAG